MDRITMECFIDLTYIAPVMRQCVSVRTYALPEELITTPNGGFIIVWDVFCSTQYLSPLQF